jgi:Mannosyltransferase (PIG-V)
LTLVAALLRRPLPLSVSLRAPSYALVVFVATRAVIWLVGIGAFLVLGSDRSGTGDRLAGAVDVGWPVDIWGNWDGAWYAEIARHGYVRSPSPAFFPLYPYLSRGLGFVLGGHVVLAAVVIALASTFGSFVLLQRLAERVAGPDVARRAVLYLALFPTAVFLGAAYAESLFLLLALATFLLADRGRIVWAGATCGLALLTRPTGVAVLAALVVFAAQRSERRRGVAAAGIAVALFAIYPLMLVWQHRDALAFMAAQQAWGREFSPLGPSLALAWALRMVVLFAQGVATYHFDHAFWTSSNVLLSTTIALPFLLLFVVLLLGVLGRFGARSPYFVYTVLCLALPLFSPVRGNPLLSLPRFGLVIFPFFLALAALTTGRPRLHAVVAATSALFLGIAIVQWSLWQWVA